MSKISKPAIYDKWVIQKTLDSGLSLDQIVATLLANRNVTSGTKKAFFTPPHPLDIKLTDLGISQKEMSKLIQRVIKSVNNKEKVIVYGDYDADGICATAILWEALTSLGVDALPHIPERFSEGYGLNPATVDRLKRLHSNLGLIITVDNGIVAYAGVKKARSLGVDVIITDHHQKAKKKPLSLATVHTDTISGSGIAWFVAREIFNKSGNFQSGLNSLELAAIGSVADQIPLVGMNRSIVKHGLKDLRSTKRVGLVSICENAGVAKENLGVYDINFIIAPRLNAMGRMKHAIESLRLLCTKRKDKADLLAAKLASVNSERQNLVNDLLAHARQELGDVVNNKVLIVSHETYHEGVIGLIAGRLTEDYNRPTIVFSKGKLISKASARSISGFNIIEAVRQMDDFLIEGGGHPMAAGFSIKTARLADFKTQFLELSVKYLTDDLMTKKLKIEFELDFAIINWELVTSLATFEPFGLGNPNPLFMTRDAKVIDSRQIGRDSSHLKLTLAKDDKLMSAIAFKMGYLFSHLQPGTVVDIAYTVDQNDWHGTKELQLKVKDVIIHN